LLQLALDHGIGESCDGIDLIFLTISDGVFAGTNKPCHDDTS
jgi:hypothetical protein